MIVKSHDLQALREGLPVKVEILPDVDPLLVVGPPDDGGPTGARAARSRRRLPAAAPTETATPDADPVTTEEKEDDVPRNGEE